MQSYNTWGFLIFMSLISMLLLAMLTGGGGLVATPLDGGITAADTTITVEDAHYLNDDGGYVRIDNERIHYTEHDDTTITVDERGARGTTAVSHLTGAILYSDDNGIINNVFNFDIGAEFKSWGILAIGAIPTKIFTETIPYLLQSKVTYIFQGDMALISVFFLGCFIAPVPIILVMWGMNWIRGN